MRVPLTLALAVAIALRRNSPVASASQTGEEAEAKVEVELIHRHSHAHSHDHHRRHKHHQHRGHRSNTTAELQAAANNRTVTTALTDERSLAGNSSAEVSKSSDSSAARGGVAGGSQESSTSSTAVTKRGMQVNGPLPPDFNQLFSEAVAEATNANASVVKVVSARRWRDGTFHLVFQAPTGVADAAQEQAADPDSRLANGRLHDFLVAKEATHSTSTSLQEEGDEKEEDAGSERPPDNGGRPEGSSVDLPMQQGIDVDTELPYGQLEPFGREDTAQELTERSITESNEMVDQLERAEVAEEKRAVFRALTRLRGAALTAFDGIARSQTGTIDQYNKLHRWRTMHPLRHLAEEEGDVSKWAFPDS